MNPLAAGVLEVSDISWRLATRALEGKLNFVKRIFSHTPNRVLTAAGRLNYPHIG